MGCGLWVVGCGLWSTSWHLLHIVDVGGCLIVQKGKYDFFNACSRGYLMYMDFREPSLASICRLWIINYEITKAVGKGEEKEKKEKEKVDDVLFLQYRVRDAAVVSVSLVLGTCDWLFFCVFFFYFCFFLSLRGGIESNPSKGIYYYCYYYYYYYYYLLVLLLLLLLL